jgi:hypothetical protein
MIKISGVGFSKSEKPKKYDTFENKIEQIKYDVCFYCGSGLDRMRCIKSIDKMLFDYAKIHVAHLESYNEFKEHRLGNSRVMIINLQSKDFYGDEPHEMLSLHILEKAGKYRFILFNCIKPLEGRELIKNKVANEYLSKYDQVKNVYIKKLSTGENVIEFEFKEFLKED